LLGPFEGPFPKIQAQVYWVHVLTSLPPSGSQMFWIPAEFVTGCFEVVGVSASLAFLASFLAAPL